MFSMIIALYKESKVRILAKIGCMLCVRRKSQNGYNIMLAVNLQMPSHPPNAHISTRMLHTT
jgi:hypothetical protein